MKIWKIEGAGADAQKSGEMTDVDAVQEQYAKALLAATQQNGTTDQAKAMHRREKAAPKTWSEICCQRGDPKGGVKRRKKKSGKKLKT